MAVVELEIPARAEYLALVRLVVAAAAGVEPRLRDERIEDLRIAVSEATTNAIEAYSDLTATAGDGQRIVIRCDVSSDAVEVEVSDWGGGFVVEAAQAPLDAADPQRLEQERGLGLPLMRVLADEADIITGDDGTTVRLVVYHARTGSIEPPIDT